MIEERPVGGLMADLDETPIPSADDEPSSSGQNTIEYKSRIGMLGNCGSGFLGFLGCLGGGIAVIAITVVIGFVLGALR